MNCGVGIRGSSVIVPFGPVQGRPDMGKPANDNVKTEPVKTVTVRKTLDQSGVAIKLKVPVDEFVGVVVSTRISEEGLLSSIIELSHPDPDLNYKVFEEVGNLNVVAEWQNWGRKLRLPLFIRSGDGKLLPYGQQVDGVVRGPTAERRRAAHEAGRRPRFLNRRKPGELELV